MATPVYTNIFDPNQVGHGWGLAVLDGYQPNPGSSGAYTILYPYRDDTYPGDGTNPASAQFELSTTRAYEGTTSLKMTISDDTLSLAGTILKYRTEFIWGDTFINARYFHPGDETWVGYAVWIDESTDITNPPYTIYNQTRTSPVSGALSIGSGKWRKSYSPTGSNLDTQQWDSGVTVNKGQWVRIIQRIKPSTFNGSGVSQSDGIYQLWIDPVDENSIPDINQVNVKFCITEYGGNDAYCSCGLYAGTYSTAFSAKMPQVAWFDSLRVAQGTLGFNDVDPAQAQTSSTPSAPSGYMSIDNDDSGKYAESSAWSEDSDDGVYGTSERYTAGENQGGTAAHSVITATFTETSGDLPAGTLDLIYYAKKGTFRATNMPWVAKLDGVEHDSGTIDLNGTTNALIPISNKAHSGGAFTFEVSNEGCDKYVAADVIFYKNTASSSLNPAVDVTTNSNTSATPSVNVPTGGAAGATYFVMIMADYSVGDNATPVITLPSGFEARCTEISTDSGRSVSTIVGRRVYTGTESGTFDASISSSAQWKMASWLAYGLDTTAPYDDGWDEGHTHDLETANSGFHFYKNNDDTVNLPALTTNTDGSVVYSISTHSLLNQANSVIATDNAGATELFNMPSGDPSTSNISMYGNYEVIATAGAATTEIHTYTNSDTANTADATAIRFAVKVDQQSALSIGDSSGWSTPISNKAKNSAAFTTDPITDGEVTGGTESGYYYVGYSNQVGCSVIVTSTTVTVTPNFGFDGAASFDLQVGDDGGNTDTCTVSFTVVNTAPVASAQEFTILISTDTTKSLVGAATDTENDALTYIVVNDTASDGTTAAMEANGTDITFTASGSTGTGVTGITFKANDGSTANDDSNTVGITLNLVSPAGTVSASDFAVSVKQKTEDNAIDFLTLSSATESQGLAMFLRYIDAGQGSGNEDASDGAAAITTQYGNIYNVGEILYYTPNTDAPPAYAPVVDTITCTVWNGTNSDTFDIAITIRPKLFNYVPLAHILFS